jgi:hypothetical protein
MCLDGGRQGLLNVNKVSCGKKAITFGLSFVPHPNKSFNWAGVHLAAMAYPQLPLTNHSFYVKKTSKDRQTVQARKPPRTLKRGSQPATTNHGASCHTP